MKKILMGLLVFVILYVLTIYGSVQAQDGDDGGYPIETETPTPTESTQAPTEPTEAPPQPVSANPMCAGTEVHPELNALALNFGVAYEELLGYFCDSGVRIGEIALALATLQNFEVELTLEELLSLRVTDGMGWGKIWISLGLIGNGMQTMSQTSVIQNGVLRGMVYNHFQVLV